MASIDLGGFDLFGDSTDEADSALPYAGSAGFGRYGHYRRPHPLTGVVSDFPRVSTVCKAVKDTYALDIWQRRMLVKGLAERPGLLDLIGATSNTEQIDQIIERGIVAAQGGAAYFHYCYITHYYLCPPISGEGLF